MVLAIYGAGELGREVWEIVQNINHVELKWDKVIFISDDCALKEVSDSQVMTYGVL